MTDTLLTLLQTLSDLTGVSGNETAVDGRFDREDGAAQAGRRGRDAPREEAREDDEGTRPHPRTE